MDDVRVAQLAARHRAEEEALKLRARGLATPAAAQAVHQQFEACWDELRSECLAFCSAYNQAFAAGRVYCQAHEDTIVVRASDHPQETLTFTRNLSPGSDVSHLSAHRYSSDAPPHALPLDMRIADAHVTLSLDGHSAPVAEVVLNLLGNFTEELVGRRVQ